MLHSHKRPNHTARVIVMAKDKKKNLKSPLQIDDEPGAEERFEQIVKRALTTPPKRKRPGDNKYKSKKAAKS